LDRLPSRVTFTVIDRIPCLSRGLFACPARAVATVVVGVVVVVGFWGARFCHDSCDVSSA
jgi:hypothetical protein